MASASRSARRKLATKSGVVDAVAWPLEAHDANASAWHPRHAMGSRRAAPDSVGAGDGGSGHAASKSVITQKPPLRSDAERKADLLGDFIVGGESSRHKLPRALEIKVDGRVDPPIVYVEDALGGNERVVVSGEQRKA